MFFFFLAIAENSCNRCHFLVIVLAASNKKVLILLKLSLLENFPLPPDQCYWNTGIKHDQGFDPSIYKPGRSLHGYVLIAKPIGFIKAELQAKTSDEI